VGRDQVATSNALLALPELITDICQKLANVTIDADARDVVEDAVVSLEREQNSEEPNSGRLKRLLLGVGKAARDVGIAVIADTIAAYAKAHGLTPQVL
jgi:hypothetical protein